MKEALYYKKLFNKKVRCILCPHECQINSGQRGICGVRGNRDGRLYSLNYARIASISNDPIEKKPLYNFYPGSMILSFGTIGCNFKCLHCQNGSISQCNIDQANFLKDLSVNDFIYLIEEEGAKLVAYTYNEPLIWYEYVLETSKLLKTQGVKTVLVTNGYINPAPLQELLPYIDAYSLDIKWSKPATAQKLSSARKPEAVFEFAKTVFSAGKHLEIVTNLVTGYNDSVAEIEGIARLIGEELSPEIPWHLTRSFPANKLPTLPVTSATALQQAAEIGRKFGLKNIHLGNI